MRSGSAAHFIHADRPVVGEFDLSLSARSLSYLICSLQLASRDNFVMAG